LAYRELQQASSCTRELLKVARQDVEAHNANHVINQSTIMMQSARLVVREEKKQGPVEKIIGTKNQLWANHGEMTEAVREQNRKTRKEARTVHHKRRAERKKLRAVLLRALRQRRAVWKKQEREACAALISEDRCKWQLDNPTRSKVPANPKKRLATMVPAKLEGPEESDHLSENSPTSTDNERESAEEEEAEEEDEEDEEDNDDGAMEF
jgi:hypothetical protein